MIRLGVNKFQNLIISDIDGLWNFPSLKNEGTEWGDEDYTEALSRNLDFQYESRIITLSCFVYGADWTELKSRINTIISYLKYDGLRMLVLSDHSNRGYMVRVSKSTIFDPTKYFAAGKCVAEFKIIFEEPQPFNVQFSYIFEADQGTINFSISKTSKTHSTASDKQQFITVNWLSLSTDKNLEQEDYIASGMFPFSQGIPYPVVVTGEIDALESISITAATEPVGLGTADYFLRNGSITFIQA